MKSEYILDRQRMHLTCHESILIFPETFLEEIETIIYLQYWLYQFIEETLENQPDEKTWLKSPRTLFSSLCRLEFPT
jgi:hypothetical protein